MALLLAAPSCLDLESSEETAAFDADGAREVVYTIRGRVLYADGTPAGGAKVQFCLPRGDTLCDQQETYVMCDGSYRAEFVETVPEPGPSIDVPIRAAQSGRPPSAQVTVVVPPGGEIRGVDFVLPAPYRRIRLGVPPSIRRGNGTCFFAAIVAPDRIVGECTLGPWLGPNLDPDRRIVEWDNRGRPRFLPIPVGKVHISEGSTAAAYVGSRSFAGGVIRSWVYHPSQRRAGLPPRGEYVLLQNPPTNISRIYPFGMGPRADRVAAVAVDPEGRWLLGYVGFGFNSRWMLRDLRSPNALPISLDRDKGQARWMTLTDVSRSGEVVGKAALWRNGWHAVRIPLRGNLGQFGATGSPNVIRPRITNRGEVIGTCDTSLREGQGGSNWPCWFVGHGAPPEFLPALGAWRSVGQTVVSRNGRVVAEAWRDLHYAWKLGSRLVQSLTIDERHGPVVGVGDDGTLVVGFQGSYRLFVPPAVAPPTCRSTSPCVNTRWVRDRDGEAQRCEFRAADAWTLCEHGTCDGRGRCVDRQQ